MFQGAWNIGGPRLIQRGMSDLLHPAPPGHTAPAAARRRGVKGPVRLGRTLALAGAGAAVALLAGSALRHRVGTSRRAESAVLRTGAGVLAGSVLFDSAIEHFRGGWQRRPMYAAPAAAALAIASATVPGARAGHAVAVGTGLAGLGFHMRNVMNRPGGICWNNLFYAAPIGAPGALATAGLLGLLAVRHDRRRPGAGEARAVMALMGAALWAESAEVWLLHYRGAFHNRGMYLPVTIPPAAAAALMWQAAFPAADPRPARRLLRATAALGVVGTGFHVYGVGRNMGGWRNWRQNTVAGPPVPAPISFSGLALAGLASLSEMDSAGGRP